ncbi:MAG: tetratricopeptide repeat protein [Xanthomonadaceae bacterium]|nr:tetratricopeptide repeat protein [Xanthomonadaceae bacterium]MDE1957543.1 tetratricopeptide repeat protein [Xanthomonadaceae bacterium]MDE2177318.1 tetratricopeptide repeat protein [Xanthomonadaceae bacterium]
MKFRLFAKTLAIVMLAFALGATAVAADKKPPEYPNAKRESPKPDLTSRHDEELLKKGFAALNDSKQQTEAQTDLQKLVSDSSSKYAKAEALRGLAQLKVNQNDYAGGIALLKQALALDSLPNDDYFDTMMGLAQLYTQNQQWQPALDTLKTWMEQGGKQTGDAYALQGRIYLSEKEYSDAVSSMQQAMKLQPQGAPVWWGQVLVESYVGLKDYAHAAQVLETQLAANPSDATTRKNLVAVYLDANQPAKALQAMEDAKAHGLIVTGTDYINLAKMYVIVGQDSNDPKPDAQKAVAALQEGFAKQVVQPSFDSYKLLGDASYLAGDLHGAVAAWGKAAPFATDGKLDMQRGQLMVQQLDQYRDGRAALQQALAKGGLEKPGVAWILIGNADIKLKDKAGALAAYRKAAQYPETKSAAVKWLKAESHGGRK